MVETRQATRYALVRDGVRYPPKYALWLAVEAATGLPLPPQAHGRGRQTNSVLERLGFDIVLALRESAR